MQLGLRTPRRPIRIFVIENAFFCLDAAWLNVTVVRAVALLSATNKVKMSPKHWMYSSKQSNKDKSYKQNNTNHIAVFQRVQRAGEGGLFLRSDGHQNVLWSVNYSQVVREQVKCKKPDVFRMQKQQKTSKHKHKPNTARRKTSRKPQVAYSINK